MKLVGGIAGAATIGGAGLATMSGGGAAATVAISASNPGQVTNDRGDLTEVTADPGLTIAWNDFDDAVGKVFWLLEAKVDGGDFHPIYRATPWLEADDIGTTGEITRHSSGSGGLGPLVVADENGKPDYSNLDFSFSGGVDEASFLDGTSMGSADEYEGSSEVLQNNFPTHDAGYYGAASDTEPLDNDDDNEGEGSNQTTPVTLRYTIELQRPNLSQMKYRVTTKYGGERVLQDDKGTLWSSLLASEKKGYAASQIDGLEESDIIDGNSEIVMNGEDGYYEFPNPSGITYRELRSHPDHVGVLVDTATFDVTVTNEGSDSGTTGNSNTGAN